MPAAQQRGQRSSDRASSRTLEAFWLANEVYPFVPGVESLFSAAVAGGVSQHNAAEAELLETGHVLRDHVPAKSVAFFSILCMYWRFRALHEQPPPSPGAQERRAPLSWHQCVLGKSASAKRGQASRRAPRSQRPSRACASSQLWCHTASTSNIPHGYRFSARKLPGPSSGHCRISCNQPHGFCAQRRSQIGSKSSEPPPPCQMRWPHSTTTRPSRSGSEW